MKNILSSLRATHKWSQADVANELGVSRQTINAIETGRYDPSLSLAFKLAKLFDITIEEIFDNGDLESLSSKASSVSD